MPDLFGLAAIVAKFALYVGVLTAAGTVMCALAFRLERYRGFAAQFGVLGFLAAVLVFSLRGANLTGDASGMTDPEMLGLLWTTPVGTALAFRLGGTGLLLAGLFMGRPGLWLSAVGGLLAIWSFDHVGHVSNRDLRLLDAALTLHLVAVAFWIGILSPLRRLAMSPATYPRAVDIGHQFGRVATVAVPLLIFLGLYMGYELVGSVGKLVGTGYGQALLLKVALVGVLLALAAANKLRFIPGVKAGDPKAAARLAKSIAVEWAVVIAILAVTALLTTNLTLPN